MPRRIPSKTDITANPFGKVSLTGTLRKGKQILYIEDEQGINTKKMAQTRAFLDKHAQVLVFVTSIAITFIMSCRLLVVGTLIGGFGKAYFWENKIVRWLDPQDTIISHTEIVLSVIGASAAILESTYQNSIISVLPILNGVAIGSVLIDRYARMESGSFKIP